jgi:hypothetical protein
MSASHIAGNRNSTPEIGGSSLRPPASRTTIGAGHGLRASSDIASLASSNLAHRGLRPSSEVYMSHLQNGNAGEVERYAGEWLSEIEQQEAALEDMAAATLEPNFKDELGAIKQWFSVLSEAERTATLYILHQCTTEVQDRFFIRFLTEKCKSHPHSGVISPANFGEKGKDISYKLIVKQIISLLVCLKWIAQLTSDFRICCNLRISVVGGYESLHENSSIVTYILSMYPGVAEYDQMQAQPIGKSLANALPNLFP